MWKDYSLTYIKNNRSSGISVMVAAFISALLLSLLCGLFYNMWKYEVERIELEEGGWHGRLAGELDREDIDAIKNYANVEAAVINERETRGRETVVDIYFHDMGAVLADMPKIAESVGILPEAVTCHYGLLALYLVRSPQDTAPRLIFPMFLIITILASGSLIVIIHNAFAVSMNTRIRQFGIFSSVGATPKQIRRCLLQEAAALCAVPAFAGNLLGIFIGWMLVNMTNVMLGSPGAGRHEAVFGYHPLVFGLTLFVTVTTIWISAWLPARKLSRLTPLEAIKNTGELQLRRRKGSPVPAFLFGMEGELAGNALKAQGKALRTASLSLALSFLAFTVMQCFFTLSGISTRETYFERYQDVWDIMVTVKGAGAGFFEEAKEIQGLSAVADAVIYQKAMAKRIITEEEISEEMKSFGGFSHASGEFVTQAGTGWMVNAPVVIMDDASFLAYCRQAGIAPQLNGAIIRNRIRDVTNPDFRHPVFMPYVKGENAVSILRQCGREEMTAEIPVLSYTEEVPVLREEYGTLDYYELVHFIPVSLWNEIRGRLASGGEDTCIRILGKEDATLTELTALQHEVVQSISPEYTVESENRIQEYEANTKQIQGMKIILGGFCVLLAVIGMGSVFSNTLGFVRQRKREFARYMSVGMTPAQLRKMFCIEALVMAGRPALTTLPLAALVMWYLLKVSYVEAGLFFAEAPLIPIAGFMSAVSGAMALAYYLGWRSVRGINLATVLRDDTMM